LKIEIEVTGESALEAAFTSLSRHIRDLRPEIWPLISAQFDRLLVEHFDTGGGSGASGPWAPLSPAYGAWKSKHYPGEPILHLTGNLRRSLTGSFNPNAHYLALPDLLERGSSVSYAGLHQAGGGGMPARPPIDFTPAQVESFRDVARVKYAEIAVDLGFVVT